MNTILTARLRNALLLAPAMLLAPGHLPAADIPVANVAEFRAALATAAGNGQDDVIHVAAGTYDVSGGTLVYDPCWPPQGCDTHSLTLEGAGAGLTVLDGGGLRRILYLVTQHFQDDTTSIAIRGMTFQNGAAPEADPQNGGGLLLYATAASVVIEQCDFLSNSTSAAGSGGGASVSSGTGSVTVRECVFEGNASAGGGGLSMGSGSGGLVLERCEFRGNTASWGGGGLSLVTSGSPRISANHFVANRADGVYTRGGAVLLTTYGSGSATLENNVVRGNIATGDAGGCYLELRGTGNLNLVNNTVTGNKSESSVGGLSLTLPAGATAGIYNNIVRGNASVYPYGGADLNLGGDGATAYLRHNVYASYGSSGFTVHALNNANIDPLFLDPGQWDTLGTGSILDDVWTDGDYRLPIGSFGIDGGTDTPLPPAVLPGTDVAGAARAVDGDGDGLMIPDIGAYESTTAGSQEMHLGAAAVDFGDVVPGFSRRYALSVANAGTSWLTLHEVSLTGADLADFRRLDACRRVAPGGTCDITLEFKPLATGLKSAALEIRSGDPAQPTVSVPLTGLARDALAWRVDGTSGDDAAAGASWASAKRTLGAAVAAAVDGDEIWVRGGTYLVGPGRDGVVVEEALAIYGGFAGTETAREQRDPAAHEVVVSGANQVRHVFRIAAGARLDGLTVAGGKAEAAPDYTEQNGGGVYVVAGSPVLAGCRIRNNSGVMGGGVYADSVAGNALLLRDCTVRDNVATDRGGGVCAMSPLVLESCDVSANRSASYGGGILAFAEVRMSGCLVAGNVSGYGGGLYASGAARVTASTFLDNSAAGDGGGILGTGIVVNSVFRGNSARFSGGGLTFEGVVANCLITGNSTGNTFNGYGAGIFSWGHSGLTISNCTIVNNTSAAWAGGVGTPRHGAVEHPPQVSNSILWGNTAPNGSQVYPYLGDDRVVVSFSDIDQDGHEGNGNIRQAPLFRDPAAQDYHLLPDSPGIDAASADLVAADALDLDGDGDTAERIPFDLDGSPRFADMTGVPDTGAGAPAYGDMGSDEFYDSDGDGIQDGPDNCVSVPNADQADADGDGAGDLCDGCASDPLKTDPGVCGCGAAETDTDGDATPDCADDDDDGDGVPDAMDGCPLDARKSDPGVCGCGVADEDWDSDGTPDCTDGCVADPFKTEPGLCGCGTPETDSDGDGAPDCADSCPADPLKTAPGFCGCGTPDADTDGDGSPDCVDSCPADPFKTAPGLCGCGAPETDADADGTPDCADSCPADPLKTAPGFCGCSIADTDADGDGTPDCSDSCPADPFKTVPGLCGCGAADTDSDADGAPDCMEQAAAGGGDGNGDGIQDSQQAEVASLETFDGTQVVTLAAPAGTTFAEVTAVGNPSPSDAPGDAVFPLGHFRFAVNLAAPGATATVTLFLPAGTAPFAFYKYGATSDNPTPHWYQFSYNGQTGARVTGDRILLSFVDGGRGDDDLTADGAVRDDGGPATLLVSAPLPGAAWEAGSPQVIRWRKGFFPRTAQVRISYSLDGGATWRTAVRSWPNRGSYPWQVPRRGIVGVADGCMVRISHRTKMLYSGVFSIGFPAITDCTPSGRTGETVTLTGGFFGKSPGSVLFGALRAAVPAGGWTAASVRAVIPKGALTGPVTIVTRAGNRARTPEPVVIQPRITLLSPSSARTGALVAIYGSGFKPQRGTGQVAFNGVPATVASWANLQITVRVPPGATSGPVVVTNGAGDTATSPADFTVLP